MLKRYSFSLFTIIDRYMLKECLLGVLALMGVLWIIYIATTYAHLLTQVALGIMSVNMIFQLLWLNSLSTLSVLLPMSAFLAVMLTLGRMSADNELTVIHACGISPRRIVRNITVFAVSMAVLVAVLSLIIVPDVLAQQYQLRDAAKLSAETTGVLAGKFKQSNNGSTFYAQGVGEDKKTMRGIFISIEQKNKQSVTIQAKSAYFGMDTNNGDQFLVLENGYRYQGDAGQANFSITRFKSHRILVAKGAKSEITQRTKALPTLTLLERGTKADIAQVQWRVSSVFMTIILCLIAVPLSQAGPRQGRYVGFVPAILIYIIYSNLLGVSSSWVENDHIPLFLGWFWVHLLMGVIFMGLLNRHKLQQLLIIKKKVQLN